MFLWEPESCEPGGYYVVATKEGNFVGSLGRGTVLQAEFEPGSLQLLGWNPLREQAGMPAQVAQLDAELAAGKTYYVKLRFGEWGANGPQEIYSKNRRNRLMTKVCNTGDAAFMAMTRMRQNAQEWRSLPETMRELTSVRADADPGKRYLEREQATFADHRALAEQKWGHMTQEGRAMIHLRAEDGVTEPDRMQR